MILNKSSTFALLAVLELASNPDRLLSSTDIAGKYGISSHHLSKLMRKLVVVGLVQAVKGNGGGYLFTGNSTRMTLLDVIQHFETMESSFDLPVHWCQGEDPLESELQCITSEIDTHAKIVLETITLATFLKNTRQHPATQNSL